jgi:UDP:flavonoid glycosyltransferase YjiC (YdhE family)
MNESLKILFIPIDGIGHVNACIGIAEVLKERGHRIIFAINESWNGKLVKYGFEEELLKESERDPNEDPAKYWANFFIKGGSFTSLTTLEKAVNIKKNLYPIFVKQNISSDVIFEEIIERLKPDVIVLDQVFCIASVINSGIPWVLSCSFNPLMIVDDDRTPPPQSGMF